MPACLPKTGNILLAAVLRGPSAVEPLSRTRRPHEVQPDLCGTFAPHGRAALAVVNDCIPRMFALFPSLVVPDDIGSTLSRILWFVYFPFLSPVPLKKALQQGPVLLFYFSVDRAIQRSRRTFTSSSDPFAVVSYCNGEFLTLPNVVKKGVSSSNPNHHFILGHVQSLPLCCQDWDIVSTYPNAFRSLVPVFTKYTDAAFPGDDPVDTTSRVALRYVGKATTNLVAPASVTPVCL